MSSMRFLHFSYLPMSMRMVYTMTLLVLGVGYLFAMIQVYEVHSGRDGKPGLDAEDIRIAYNGNPSGTKLESALNGPMQGMAPESERLEILKWIHDGATQEGYDSHIKAIMDTRCIACHNGSDPSRPNLSNFDGVSKVVTHDEGASIGTLVRISHIHLFGITFIFYIVSSIFAHSYLRPLWLKCIVIVIPFITILMDIASWYLTKLWPSFAWMIIISGGMMGLSFATQWLTSMYQMWFYSPPEEVVMCNGNLPVMGEKAKSQQPI